MDIKELILDSLDYCSDLTRALGAIQILNEKLYDTNLPEEDYSSFLFARDASVKEAKFTLQEMIDLLEKNRAAL